MDKRLCHLIGRMTENLLDIFGHNLFHGLVLSYRKGTMCIPMNPDTDSNNLRTPIPIQSGHPFRSKADTPQLERSDAGKFVNASRYF